MKFNLAQTLVFGILLAGTSQFTIAQNARTVTLNDLTSQFMSEDDESRLRAVKQYAASPYQYGAEGLELISLALGSQDDAVIEAALVGLRRLVTKGTVSKSDVRDHFSSAEPDPIEILRFVNGQNNVISISAAFAFYSIYGESADLELAAIERFATADNDVIRRDIVRVIAVGGVTTTAGSQLFTEIIKSYGASDATILAAEALAKSDPPYLPALEHLVELAKSDDFFAKPSLVKAIGMYGESAKMYLADLRWMRAEVDRQAELPRLERSKNLHNSSFSLQVLDEVISQFELYSLTEI